MRINISTRRLLAWAAMLCAGCASGLCGVFAQQPAKPARLPVRLPSGPAAPRYEQNARRVSHQEEIEPEQSPTPGVPKAGSKTQLPAEKAASKRPPRMPVDPTIPSPEIRELLEPGVGKRLDKPSVNPSTGYPEILVKARIFQRQREPLALLDVGGRMISVRAGSEFSVASKGTGENAVRFRVVELNQSEIRLEIEGRKQTISLN